MARKVECECRVTLLGQDDDEIFAKVTEHAGSVHGMEVTREQAPAMAKPVRSDASSLTRKAGPPIGRAGTPLQRDGSRRRRRGSHEPAR